jgi:hypothetical protein
MELRTKKLWGYFLSVSGLVLLALGAIDYLKGIGGAVAITIFGLILAAVGMYINNRILFGEK